MKRKRPSLRTKEMVLSAPGTNYDLLPDEEKARYWSLTCSVDTSPEGLIEDNARERGIVVDWDVMNEAIARMERNALNVLQSMGFQASNEGHLSDGGLAVTLRFNFENRELAEQASEFGLVAGSQEHFPLSQYYEAIYEGVPDDYAGLVDVDLFFYDDTDTKEFIEWLEDHKLDLPKYWNP